MSKWGNASASARATLRPIWRLCAVDENGGTLVPDRRRSGRVNEGKETPLTRRRCQKGCLVRKGKNWVLRYREDILNPDGTVGHIHRSLVLGALRTKAEA
jgi:hypothetical protein